MRMSVRMLCVLMLLNCLGHTRQLYSQTNEWKNTVFGFLEQRQYHFRQDRDRFYGINKSAGIKVTFSPLTQHTESREGLSAFSYDLRLSSIYTGNYHVPLYDAPQFEASENRLLEKHQAFTIEYINDVNGVKQNFILPYRINNRETLVLTLNLISDKCAPRLKNGEVSIQVGTGQKTFEVARYSALKVYDARGVELPSLFSVKNGKIVIEVDHRQAVYPLTIDPLSTTAALHVTGSQAASWLGYCVSGAGDVNGDGFSDVIVGAPKYDNGQANEGAAFVYLGSATGLLPTPAWSAEGNQISANFGVSVSEAGDVNGDGYGDIIVGADQFDNGETNEGKAYVFYGNAAGVSPVAAWTYEANQVDAKLGFVVSTAGDVNRDGFSDVLVGAPSFDNGQLNEGVAYVFHGSASGPAAAPNTILEANQAGASYGWSLSAAGDVNSDGFADIIVSAVYYDNIISNEGKAWVHLGTATGINTTAAWTNEGNQVNAYYGENVSWAGDVNGDGYGDVVVGADYFDNGQADEGRAYVYYGYAAGVGTTPAVVLESNQAGAYFGVGVNGAGDVNGDGYGDLVVGAYYYDNGEANEGVAFVYYGSSTGISPALFTLLDADQAGANYGVSVCSAGDVNGNGFSDIIIGSYTFDQITPTAISNAGAFCIYEGDAEGIGTTPFPAVPFTLTQAGAALGNFVTCIGDVNRDGFSDMAVGACLYDNTVTDRGVVYIFHGSSTGYGSAPNTTIHGPGITGAVFGSCIGAAGDVNADGYSDIVVGAPGLSNGHSSEGGAYVYLGGASGINPTPHLSIEGGQNNAQLGNSVGGAGDVNGDGYSDIVIGAKGYSNGQTNEGRAYVYYGSAAGVDATADWQYETNIASERFGTCVTGVGDVNGDGYSEVVVLSSGYSSGQVNEGRMHCFHGGPAGLATTAASVFETNVTNAGINEQSTTFAGDLNGDGHNEVVLGIPAFNNGSTPNEGLIRIYYGAYPNLGAGTVQNIEGNAANFYLGATVGFGGDVNGDGYQDLITGAPLYSNGSSQEGVARVYQGAAAGLNPSPVYIFEPGSSGIAAGSSVCSAGDLNGDGYSDILVGAKDYDAGAAPLNTGRVYVFLANHAHGIIPKTMLSHQYKSDLTTPVQTSNGTFEAHCNFGISHHQKAHLGRARARLLYEVRGHPDPFDNATGVMCCSVAQSGIQGSYTYLAATGSTLKMPASAIPPMGFPKWRARVYYHRIDAIDGQMYGRWYFGGIHDKQDRSIKVSMTTCGVLSVALSSYQVNCTGSDITLQWTMGDETNVAAYEIHTSSGDGDYQRLTEITATGSGAYVAAIENDSDIKLVKLVAIDNNLHAHEQFTAVATCEEKEDVSLSVFPNPSSSFIRVSLTGWNNTMGEVTATEVVDMGGRQVYHYKGYATEIDVSAFGKGFYQISLLTGNGKKFSTRFACM